MILEYRVQNGVPFLSGSFALMLLSVLSFTLIAHFIIEYLAHNLS